MASTATLVTARQQPQGLPRLDAGWRPRKMVISDSRRVTAEHRRTILTNLAAAETLIRSVEEFAKPRGFEVKATWRGGSDSVSADRSRSTGLSTIVFEPVGATEGPMVVDIRFNPEPGVVSASTLTRDERGRQIYLERAPGPPVSGAAASYGTLSTTSETEGSYILFTSRSEPLFVSVSRGELLEALIFQAEKDQRESLARIAEQTGGSTPYQRWLAEAPARKQAREGMVAVQSDPAVAAKMREDFAKIERETGEALKKSEAGIVRQTRELQQELQKPVAEAYRRQLAALTPSERALLGAVLGKDVVPTTTQFALRAVRENPEFYRARRSPYEARGVFIHLKAAPASRADSDRAVFALHQKLDWAAFNRLLDQRP